LLLNEAALGGGADIFPSLADSNRDTAPVVLRTSEPSIGNGVQAGWFAQSSEIGAYTFAWHMLVYAVCANVTPTATAAVSEDANAIAPVAVTVPATTTAATKNIFLPFVMQ